MWKEGSIRVNGDIFHYWIKQYEEGSEWGIEGGRISKLMLKRDGKIVCNYDRGWDSFTLLVSVGWVVVRADAPRLVR